MATSCVVVILHKKFLSVKQNLGFIQLLGSQTLVKLTFVEKKIKC